MSRLLTERRLGDVPQPVDGAVAVHSVGGPAYNLISWDTVSVGHLGGFDLGASATIWTAPKGGVYQVSGGGYTLTATGGSARRFMAGFLNGVQGVGTQFGTYGGWTNSSSDEGITFSSLITLSAADVLRFYVWTSTVGPQNWSVHVVIRLLDPA